MLELGITFSFTQLLIDAEIIKMVKRVLQSMPVNSETLAVEVIKSVGAGGNYLNQKHTKKHMRKEQSRATLIDRRMRDRWLEKGGQGMADRATEKALTLLREHKPEPLDLAVAKQIRDIVESAEENR